MKQLALGIVGFGFMGKMHAHSARTLPFYYDLPYRLKVAGVCCRTQDKAENASSLIGDGCIATCDISELLACEDIDAVAISTPNLLHHDQVMAAIAAKKHVYCDKPLAVSAEDANNMAEAAQLSGVIAQAAMQNRFYPCVLRAKQMIGEGALGRITGFRACYLHSGSVDAKKPIGWKQDKSNGGGVLLDLGSHVLDLLYYLAGEFASVSAVSRILHNLRPLPSGKVVPIEAEDAVYILVKLPCGAAGTVEASKIATGTQDELRLELEGENGAIKLNLMDPNWLLYYDVSAPGSPLGGIRGFTKIECVGRYKDARFPGEKFNIGFTRAHAECLHSFFDSIYYGRAASPSFSEAAYIQHVMECVQSSAISGKSVDI